MNYNLIQLSVVFLAGTVLGLIYFGGLWLTLRRIHKIRYPGLLLLISFVTRIATVMLAFYFVMAGEWENIVMCLAGFLVMRHFMIHIIQSVETSQNQNEKVPS